MLATLSATPWTLISGWRSWATIWGLSDDQQLGKAQTRERRKGKRMREGEERTGRAFGDEIMKRSSSGHCLSTSPLKKVTCTYLSGSAKGGVGQRVNNRYAEVRMRLRVEGKNNDGSREGAERSEGDRLGMGALRAVAQAGEEGRDGMSK
ncbi:hypothetical protein B0H19DRAFT_1199402, partial [Mycena capillaripes]